MNNITKLATALLLAAVPATAALAADKPAKAQPAAAKSADAKPSAGADDPAKAAGPKLHMAHGKNPGKDVDLRHCLDLGTNAEVIRCAEQGERKE